MSIEFTTQEVDCGTYPSIRSALLFKRTIFLSQPINNQTAEEVIAQLLYLDSINHEPIKLIINSPGGVSVQVSASSTICMASKAQSIPTHSARQQAWPH